MASAEESSGQTQTSSIARSQSRAGHGGKHVHHGRTPAAWTGVAIAMTGTLLGGLALVAQNWVLFWIAAALCVIAIIATVVMQRMGYGAD